MTPQSLHFCSEAIGRFVAEHGTRAVGQMVGVDATTVGRWGTDPARWPSSALLIIAHHDDAVRRAVVSGLTGADATDPVAVIAHAADAIESALLSGDMTIRDAMAKLPLLAAVAPKIRALHSDLTAFARGAAVFGRRHA